MKGSASTLMAGLVVLTGCQCDRVLSRPLEEPNRVAVPTVRAGEVDGAGSLANVAHGELGLRDEFLVADGQARMIVIFGRDGEFDRTVGRAGSGPGEFTQVSRIGWTHDTLWTLDVFASRIHLWDPDLRFVRTITTIMPAPPEGAFAIFPGPVMADGSILGVPAEFGPHPGVPLLLIAEDGSIVRELTVISTEGKVVEMELSTGPFDVSNPWSDAPLWLNAADGKSVVVVDRRVTADPDRGEFLVTRIDVNGDTLVHEALEYTPEPLESARIDEALDGLAVRVARARSVPEAEAERVLRSALSPPAFLSPVTELVSGRDGTIWLRREESRGYSVDWQVLSPAAEPVARVRLPVDFSLHGAELEQLWGVVRDSLGVPFIQVYEVRSPAN